jgi:hypothetical protein
MGIFHDDPRRFAFDPANSPRRVPQQHDFSRHALDGEIFIDRADDAAIRFGDNREQRIVRNRAAAGNRSQTRAAPCPQFAIDAVMMQVGAIAPALRSDAFGKHREHFIKRLRVRLR